jgi:peptide/nickel transport system permease protein
VLLAMVLGVTLGLIAGYVGGWVETLIMRIADVQLTFPAILVAMLIFGIAKGITPPEYRDQMAIWVLILAIGLSDWVQFARVVRGATLVEQSREYVQAARLIGRSPRRSCCAHPAQRAVAGAGDRDDQLALAIIAEATLSFLGVGAPPTKPSLGTLIRIGQGFLFSGEWWILLLPGLNAAGAGAVGQPAGRLAARRAEPEAALIRFRVAAVVSGRRARRGADGLAAQGPVRPDDCRGRDP